MFQKLLTFVFISLVGACSAQDFGLDYLFSKPYTSPQEEVLHDIILLRDGRIGGVGYRIVDGRKNGLFAIFDSNNGELLLKKEYEGSPLDDEFFALAESGDGRFFLVGKKDQKEGNKAWVMQVDEVGEPIPGGDRVYGMSGNDSFDHIAWLDSEIGILHANMEDTQNGYIRFLTTDGKTDSLRIPYGEGLLQEVIALLPNPNDSKTVWICGIGENKKNKSWAGFVNNQGKISNTQWFSKGKTSQSKAAAALHNGQLAVADEYGNTYGETDIVIHHLLPERGKSNQYYFASNLMDKPVSICGSPFGGYWVLGYQASPASGGMGTTPTLFWVDKNERKNKKYTLSIPECEISGVKKIIQTPINTYVILCTAKCSDNPHEVIGLLSFKNGDLLSAKSLPKLENQGIRLQEIGTDNPDERISPNERAVLKLSIKNVGDDMQQAAQVVVEEVNMIAGLEIIHKKQFTRVLARDMEQTISIGLKASDKLQSGLSEVKISVFIGDSKQFTTNHKIESIETLGANAGTSLHFRNPPAGSREVTTPDNTYPLKLDIYANSSKIKKGDAVISNNNVIIEDGKADPYMSTPAPSNNQFYYSMQVNVPLDTGMNKVVVRLDDQTSDTVYISFAPEQPNLHILSIGVPYENLKYTSKDAQDFADVIIKQAGNGFFNEVFVETLVTEKETRTLRIQAAFEKLFNRFLKKDKTDRIKPNDYLIVFISSHGIVRKDGRFCLVPSDYETDPELENTYSIDYKDILDTYLTKIHCKRFVFIDACHSGAGKDLKPSQSELSEKLNLANLSAPGMAVFSSSSEKELSYEYKAGENGIFTEALIEIMTGQKTDGTQISSTLLPNEDAFISLDELNTYLRARVPQLLEETEYSNFNQNPQSTYNELPENLTIFLKNSN